jgi:hypothetical protein
MFQGTIDTGAAMAVEATANGDVLFDLGVLYSSGRNGLIDLIAAHKWFNLAALKGRVDAISLRQEIAGQMSSAEIAAAQREARAWMTTHCWTIRSGICCVRSLAHTQRNRLMPSGNTENRVALQAKPDSARFM